MRRTAGVVPPGNKNHVMISGRHRYIKTEIICENPLNTEGINRVEAVEIGFFQIGDSREIVFIMAMRRVR